MASFYEPRTKYTAMIIDLLSPECSVFVVGLNGDVREYPTKEWVELTGAQLNLLMTCTIPVEETEVSNGMARIVGHRETPRFAINVSGFGAMPAAEATVLEYSAKAKKPAYQQKKEVITLESTPVAEEELTEEEKEIVNAPSETAEERKAVLQAASRDELLAYCKGNNIEHRNQDNAKVLVNKILKAEGLR